MPPAKMGLGMFHGNHVVLIVQPLGFTGGAEVKVHTREALVADAKDVALTSVAHHTVVVHTISASSMVMVVVGVPRPWLLSWLRGGWLWLLLLCLLLRNMQGMDAEQLPPGTLQAQR